MSLEPPEPTEHLPNDSPLLPHQHDFLLGNELGSSNTRPSSREIHALIQSEGQPLTPLSRRDYEQGPRELNHVLAEMAKGRMRRKIPELVEALTGHFSEHHAFLCRMHLERIDQISASILELSGRIEEAMRPFARQLEQLQTNPGIGQANAEAIIAETGADMTIFATAAHLASWAGTVPGHNESAGKRKPTKTRHGNRWLAGALGVAALSASRTKDTYLSARYRRLVPHTGKAKALVALQHSMHIATWHMLTDNVPYQDLGGAYFEQLNPDRAKHRAIAQLRRLGYDVELTPTPA